MSAGEQTPTVVFFGDDLLDRMVRAVENVRERLTRSTKALEKAGIPYAVAGGNAVAAWVSRVDPGAARNTVDVDLIVNRGDLDAIKTAMAGAGFVYAYTYGVHMFLDGPDGRPRDAVHLLFAGEKVDPRYSNAAPDLSNLEPNDAYRLIGLESLVRMKLTSFRDKDRTHLRDMIDVGLLDSSWLNRVPADLAPRLKELFDNPEG